MATDAAADDDAATADDGTGVDEVEVESVGDAFVRRQVRVDLSGIHPRVAERTLKKYAATIVAEARQAAARTRRVSWYTEDDYRAVAQIAVLEALVTYREGCGAVFGTWVRRVVRWRLNETVARLIQQHRGQDALPTEQVDGVDGADVADGGGALDATYGDQQSRVRWHEGFDEERLYDAFNAMADSPEDSVAYAELVARILHAVSKCSWREQEALYALLNGQSGASLGRQLGLTRQRVHHHRARAIALLRTVVAS